MNNEIQAMRVCSMCGASKVATSENFYIQKRATETSREYLFGRCKPCISIVRSRIRISRPFMILSSNAKQVARRRWGDKAEFDLTEDFLESLWNKQEGKCFWTKTQMVLPEPGGMELDAASIDRIDGKRHYTQDNVVLCCTGINFCRNRSTPEQFKAFLRKLKLSMI